MELEKPLEIRQTNLQDVGLFLPPSSEGSSTTLRLFALQRAHVLVTVSATRPS